MDINEMPMDSTEYGGLTFPYGLGTVLGMEEEVTERPGNLTETEREHIIMRCRDAGSEEEVRQILDEAVPGESMQSLLDRDRIR